MEISDESLKNVFTNVGRIIVQFAILEAQLDVCIAMVFQAGGGKDIENDLPRSLDRRLRFLKKCLNQLPLLVTLKGDGIPLMDEIDNEAEIRNNCAHGYIHQYDESTQTAYFYRLDAFTDTKVHTEDKYKYSLQEMLDAGKRILAIGARMNEFNRRAFELLKA